jgi:serine/threonine protein kinase
MALSSGTKLGPYEIVAALGAGGMGEVYRARDTRLGRDVAVKVLPASYSDDKQRLQRFEQEACAAGALNHPNILVIHHIDTHEGAPYVSELLEGKTLREQLTGVAAAQRTAINYALQIANGLAAAHDKGIIRDLKPENILTKSCLSRAATLRLRKQNPFSRNGDDFMQSEARSASRHRCFLSGRQRTNALAGSPPLPTASVCRVATAASSWLSFPSRRPARDS